VDDEGPSMSDADRPKPETLCARSPGPSPSATRPLVEPIHLSSVYRMAGLDQVDAVYRGEQQGFVYARDGHPNAAQLAARLAELESAEAGLVCASGMGAEAAVALALLDRESHVALADSLYGKTTSLFVRELARFGVSSSLFDPTESASLARALNPQTRLVLVETLSNPLVRLADLEGLAHVSREARVPLVVDNTFAPLICRPIEQGATLVIHSLTKLIGGHSDLTLGVVVGSRPLIDRAASVASTFGLTGNPFESWLCARGLATLGVRSARACATALDLAGRIESHRHVQAVHYPGLTSHPDHLRAPRMLAGGFGTIVTFDLGTREAADAFIRDVADIPFAPSLADVSTTLSHPATTSHRGQPAELLEQLGITPGLIRLSIGLEDPDDLWDAMGRALDVL
jgi:cystathionine beta-lyase/cystathionine gamma-synthase